MSIESVLRSVTPILIRIAVAFAVLVIGRMLARYGRKALQSALQHTGLTESMISLFIALTYYGILIISIVTALIIIGLPVASVVVSLSVIIIVLAVALQQSLADLAATINFLLFKPFEVGDLIETGGDLGVVQEIQLFSTVVLAPDQKKKVLPNSKIQSGGLANYSKTGDTRLDLTFGIGYNSDVNAAKKVIADILAADERVLTEPPPQIFIGNLGDSSIDITVWPHVHISDYFSFLADIVENVKKGFDEAGIIIPFPQRDVHLISDNQKT